ncbi:MAG: PAS domain-containing protein [Bacteroidales bacterium]|nr:PAS domain-containing protein [Bacteroidales bacterium]
MSEFINNKEKRVENLFAFCIGIINRENGKKLIEKHQFSIDQLTPHDVIEVVDKLIRTGISTEVLKKNIGKILNVFYKPIVQYPWKKPREGPFWYYLIQENRAVEKFLNEIKISLKLINKKAKLEENYFDDYKKMRENLLKLNEFILHYDKKENILFPYIEKAFEDYRCLQIMWSFHDDIRKKLKEFDTILQKETPDLKELNKEVAALFFLIVPIIFREEAILFPVALERIAAKDFVQMNKEAEELGYVYDVQSNQADMDAFEELAKMQNKHDKATGNLKSGDIVDLETGYLLPEQLKIMLNTLPLDITYVDENDVVRYFSSPKDRFFTRSKAIIGRTVQNCHPPESIHVVDKIVNSFKSGEKDEANFWIQMRGKFILIRYFALRDEKGNYKGTLEVSQDITEIRKLEGEQRLLDWK